MFLDVLLICLGFEGFGICKHPMHTIAKVKRKSYPHLYFISKHVFLYRGNGMSSDMNGTQTQHTNQNQETHYYSLN